MCLKEQDCMSWLCYHAKPDSNIVTIFYLKDAKCSISIYVYRINDYMLNKVTYLLSMNDCKIINI